MLQLADQQKIIEFLNQDKNVQRSKNFLLCLALVIERWNYYVKI